MNPRAEARHRQEHAENPMMIHGPEEADFLIDSLLESPVSHNLAQVHSLDRDPMPSGYPDHELMVGVDKGLKVGVISFMDAEYGNIATLGSPEGRVDVAYSINGAFTEFPKHSEIPLDLLRQAVKEFVSSGGKRPSCVQWQVIDCW